MSRRTIKPEHLKDENDVKKEIIDYLDKIGAYHFHIMQGQWSKKGVSDRIAVVRGLTFFIEIKRPKGKQSSHQIDFMDKVLEKGGLYICVDNVEDLHEYIRSEVKKHEHRNRN